MRYLDHATRRGRVTIRTLDLCARLRVERSEVYRITRRLRALGLLGVEDDRGGTRGGRRYWRTAIEHDGAELDQVRHRDAWARIVAWSRSHAARAAESMQAARAAITYATRPRYGETTPAVSPVLAGPSLPPGGPPGRTFAELCRSSGLGDLMDTWGVK